MGCNGQFFVTVQFHTEFVSSYMKSEISLGKNIEKINNKIDEMFDFSFLNLPTKCVKMQF